MLLFFLFNVATRKFRIKHVTRTVSIGQTSLCLNLFPSATAAFLECV